MSLINPNEYRKLKFQFHGCSFLSEGKQLTFESVARNLNIEDITLASTAGNFIIHQIRVTTIQKNCELKTINTYYRLCAFFPVTIFPFLTVICCVNDKHECEHSFDAINANNRFCFE